MSSTRLTLLCHYSYDALNRLISDSLADKPVLRRFYCESRISNELQGAARRTIFSAASCYWHNSAVRTMY